MARRRIDVRFLNKERTCAEVVVMHDPSWLARLLFGARSWKKTTTAVFRTGWLHETDRRIIDDDEVRNSLEWHRRWDVTIVEELPRARLVDARINDFIVALRDHGFEEDN